jgi:thiol-disulfide isomerase/thioredoxin
VKPSRRIVWPALALAIAAALALLSPSRNDGLKSKGGDAQALDVSALPGLERLAPPRAAPDVSFMAGPEARRARRLTDYRGRVVLLNLWATWCAPCVRELPSLDRLQGALGGDAFTVLAVSLDREGAVKVTPFLRDLGVARLEVLTDPAGDAMRALGVSTLPTSILIDAEGQMVARMTGPAEWDSAEAKALIGALVAKGQRVGTGSPER